MMTLGKTRWLRRIGLAVIAAAGVGAAAIGVPAPAQAQWYNPYYYPYYRPHYARPYRNPGYAPGYRGCPPGWHFARGHWNAWGRWVPPGCRRNWW